MTSSAFIPNRKRERFTPGPSISPAGFHYSAKQLALQCLADTHNDPDRAVALAGRYAHGRRLRETIAAIGNAWLGTALALNHPKPD
jgi:hypothetical protein